MRVIVTGDTHRRHEALGTLSGDVLIHCGDVENLFEPDDEALESIDAWFGRQEVEHVLCIGGNHDLELERRHRAGRMPFRNAVYLQDSDFEWRGIRFYGTPWTPMLQGHAFYADDDALVAAWAMIPEDVEVLITHTPPGGMLDVSSAGQALGCPHLAARLRDLTPALHCFGHVHASAGLQRRGSTTYVNASAVQRNYQIAVPPFVFDRDDNTGKWRRR